MAEAEALGLADLALELIAHIFSYIPTSELAQVATVCRRFSEAMWVDLLWMVKCEEDKALTWKSVDVTWREFYTMDLSELCPHLNRFDRYQLPWILERLDEKLGKRDTLHCDGDHCPITINNLWMCVEPGCGFVGCGRRDRVHMMKHIHLKKHHLTLKMYCYTCEQWIGGPGRHAVEQSRYRELREVLARCTGKTFDAALVDRRTKERSLPVPLNNHRYWAVIAMPWEKKWERFIIGDDDAFKDPIDNGGLVYDGRVRAGLRSGTDYQICSVLAWKYFQATYGGGPTILWDWHDHRFVVDPQDWDEIVKKAEENEEQEKLRQAQRKKKKTSLKKEAAAKPRTAYYLRLYDGAMEGEEGEIEVDFVGDDGDFDEEDDYMDEDDGHDEEEVEDDDAMADEPTQ